MTLAREITGGAGSEGETEAQVGTAVGEVSVVCTLLNEEGTVGQLLESLTAQSCAPVEVIIVDGGSVDRTVAVARERAAHDGRIRVHVVWGANRSEGRNYAIRKARHELIAVTDGGCIASRRWLESITAPLRAGTADVVSGFYEARACGGLDSIIGEVVVPRVQDVIPESFLPSSRSVAFRKACWQAVGGYPELFEENEDTVFDLLLREAGCRFAFAPQALVYWRPRRDLLALFRQYLRFGVGDGKGRIHTRRYLRMSVRLCGAMTALVAAIVLSPLSLLLIAAGLCVYVRRHRNGVLRGSPWAIALKIVVIAVCTIAWMAGYLVGLVADVVFGCRWSRMVPGSSRWRR